MLRRSCRLSTLTRPRKVATTRKANAISKNYSTSRRAEANPALLYQATLLAVGAATLWYYKSNAHSVILNDAETKSAKEQDSNSASVTQLLLDDEHLTTIAWGSNK